jgi:hypothetical protein
LIRNPALSTAIRQRIFAILDEKPEPEIEMELISDISSRPQKKRPPSTILPRFNRQKGYGKAPSKPPPKEETGSPKAAPRPTQSLLTSLLSKEDDEYEEEIAELQLPIGVLVQKPGVALPFELRDLTNGAWIERATFLSKLLPVLEVGNLGKVSGLELVDCVLTTAFPLHRKVSPLLAQVLAKLLLFFPEALRVHIVKILEFYLGSIRKPPMLTSENGKTDFEDVLLTEGHADPLIACGLSLVLEIERPLEVERLFAKIYKRRPETVLPWATLRTLLAYLLRPRIKGKWRDFVLTQVGKNQADDVLSFYQLQTKELKRELRPFIPIKPRPATVFKPLPFDEFLIQNRTQYELHKIVENEKRKGVKGNFTLIATVLQRLTFQDLRQMQQGFSSFLVYVGSLPTEMLHANEKLLVVVCTNVFHQAELLNVLRSQIVSPRLLIGLAAYVWHCPTDVLKSASQYYARLYELFCESESEARSMIIRICVAFEKVTGKTILDLPQISKQHRFLITSLISQYGIRS